MGERYRGDGAATADGVVKSPSATLSGTTSGIRSAISRSTSGETGTERAAGRLLGVDDVSSAGQGGLDLVAGAQLTNNRIATPL